MVCSEDEKSTTENMSASPLHAKFPSKTDTLIAVQNVLSKHHKESQVLPKDYQSVKWWINPY